MADGSSEMTTDGGAELAKAIDAAVQTTIEKELRPGGILREDKMALGFSTGSSFGNRTIVPDKGLSRSNKPVVL